MLPYPLPAPLRLRFGSIPGTTALFLLIATAPASAQSNSWPTVSQGNAWYGRSYEQVVSPTLAIVTDVQLRRNGFLEHPKQLDMVAGLAWRATAGLRLAVGGSYTSSTPYGLLPAPRPTREHLLWYQLQLQQHAGPVDFSHRYRFENRWVHDVARDDAGSHDVNERFNHRLRYQIRASHSFSKARMHGQPMLVYAADELFLGLTAAERHVAVEQNRSSIGLGLPISGAERLEVGYMHQIIANTRYKTMEVNHILLLVLVHTLPR